MNRYLLNLFYGIFVCFFYGQPLWAAEKSGVSIVPDQLTCEYQTNPLGVDQRQPRLGWILQATNSNAYGQRQRAYRILVDTDSAALAHKKGGCWDSGWIQSSDTQHIPYQGKSLTSDHVYFWCVAVQDEQGSISSYSPIAKWTSALFDEKDWTSSWIGTGDSFHPKAKDCNLDDPWFRKTVTLEDAVADARIYVASIGFHELYVNGKKIGNPILTPAVTDHSKRARYVTYDIAPYLHRGQNTIAFWLGTGWSIYAPYATADKPRGPILRAQACLYDASGKQLAVISTDKSWKTHPSPNKLLGNWSPNNFGGELFDANKDIPNWNLPDFSDQSWKHAKEFQPKLVLSAQAVEDNILFKEIRPVDITSLPNGDYRVDMGVNFAGWTEIEVKGSPGKRIDFLYSERSQEEMTFKNRSAYIVGPTGQGTFRNRFNYSSGRWITIRGAKEKPELSAIKGWAIRTGFMPVTEFSCSDSLQNWIYDRIVWTYSNLSLGGMIVDCPQRERMGYGGDAHATSETGMANFNMAAFYEKWMQDWRDVQGTESMVGDMNDPSWARIKETSGRIFNNGILPHTAPTYWGGGGPAWGGIVVMLPWSHYQQYGDLNILKNNFNLIKTWIAYINTHVQDNILQPYGGTWDFLGDWLWPNATAEGMNNNKAENICFNNLYRVYNLRTAVRIALAIGEKEHAQVWEQQADLAADAINSLFYNTQLHLYADGSMANQALALLSEVAKADDREKILEQLAQDIMVNRRGHIHAGITGGALLFKYLRSAGRHDLLYSMLKQETYPSWGYMKANGATTIWEMWEKDLPGHSLLHSSFLYPGAWYIDGLAGIKPLNPGYRSFVIQVPRSREVPISWVKTSFRSPCGLIKIHWQRDADKLQLEAVVPPNTTATLKVPKEDHILMLPDDKRIRPLAPEDHYLVFELQPGAYHF
ncbi:family 78 glycoside hydrolase catalytic domain [Sphingobacterium sp. HMA12]|uniref:family 78 glycoside hydrolase catalytic domain n=1 Tax=Sphingobacterium sp. HMA12 TaxID=2050894 RepID=UPI000CEA12D1|nr:family 78 glycoside hydrolase catalytic domain [Sphingobacterium sp. HMA12]